MPKTVFIVTNAGDQATNEIIMWLDHFKQKYCRINSLEDVTELIRAYNDHEINSIFYRRSLTDKANKKPSSRQPKAVALHLNLELQHAIEHISSSRKFYQLGSLLDADLNRMTNLTLAQEVGLSVPSFIIAASRKDVLDFMSRNMLKFIAIKPMTRGPLLSSKGSTFTLFTEKLGIESAADLPDFFYHVTSVNL